MKRFVISIVGASVFFLGLGGIVEHTGAKFKSDQKALELISRAREAIGGDASLRGVNSMTIAGTATQFSEKDGIPSANLGAVEINLEMPAKFSKTIKIGNPPDTAADGEMHKKIDVVVLNNEGDSTSAVPETEGADKNVFVIRKGDGDVEWKTSDDVEFRSEGGKVLMRKDDGSVVELPRDGKHKIIVRESAESGDGVWNTEDGRKIVIERDSSAFGGLHGRSGGEMLRTTLGLLMTAPEGIDVSYKYEGEQTVDGYPANVIFVEAPGTSFKLFLDASTNLPRMISFTGHNAVFLRKTHNEEISKEELIEMKMKAAIPVEHQIRFSDFRSVDGLMLPYRWSESVGGRQTQIIDVSTYEINPPNIADKFGKEKVFVRKMKPENN